MFKESVRMALQHIFTHKMRSFLTVLGIVIGVAAIIALITIVQGVTVSVTDTVSGMGANRIMIQSPGTPIKQGLTNDEMKEFETIDNVSGVSPTINGMSSVVYNGAVKEEVTILGKNDDYFFNDDELVDKGRTINPLDVASKNKVALIGEDIVEEWFPTKSPIGEKIRINGFTHTIIGTLKASNGFDMTSNNDSIVIPSSTALSVLGMNTIQSVDIFMEDGEKVDQTIESLELMLNRAFNYNEDGFKITNMQSILDQVKETTGMMQMMLVGIASISLLVGGIGIMNMMLVSVTERTTEIGLRKALGAQPSRIQQQFLIESLVLSLMGGIIGLLIGTCMAFVASMGLGTEFNLEPSTIIIAIGFTCVIGVIFGWAPARKASRLNPIEALRAN